MNKKLILVFCFIVVVSFLSIACGENDTTVDNKSTTINETPEKIVEETEIPEEEYIPDKALMDLIGVETKKQNGVILNLTIDNLEIKDLQEIKNLSEIEEIRFSYDFLSGSDDELFKDFLPVQHKHEVKVIVNVESNNAITSTLDKVVDLDGIECKGTNISTNESFLCYAKSRALTYLNIGRIENYALFNGFDSLEHLYIDDNANYSLDEISTLTNLETLHINAYHYMSGDLSPLSNLINLTDLAIYRAYHVQDLNPIGKLTKLEKLSINSGVKIRSTIPLGDLTNIEEFEFSGDLMNKIKMNNLNLLENYPNLRKLSVSYTSVRDINMVKKFPDLESLDLIGCYDIKDTSVILELNNLESLKITGEAIGDDIDNLKNFPKLTELVFECYHGEEINVISELVLLKRLDLRWLYGMTNLYDLNGLSSLEFLKIEGCKNITEIGDVEGLDCLVRIDIVNCDSLTDIDSLSSITTLKNINIYGCDNLVNLSNFNDSNQIELCVN